MKFKILSFLLAFALVCLAGCTPNQNPSDPSTTATPPASSSAAPLKDINMQELYTQLSAKMPEMMLVDDSMLFNYYGIDTEDCKQAVVAICSNALLTDEVWLIEAKNADALAHLETLANNRLAAKAAESETYSPEQFAVVKKAKLILQENYLILLVSPDVDALESIYRAAAGLN